MTAQSNASQTSEISILSSLSYQESQNSETQITSTSDEGIELTANADGVTFFLPWRDLNRLAKPIGLALIHVAFATYGYLAAHPPIDLIQFTPQQIQQQQRKNIESIGPSCHWQPDLTLHSR